MSRTIVVGDIHGCYTELQDLLGEIGLKSEDRLISVGDIVTKGFENRVLFNFFQTRPNSEAVIGNHELVLLRHYRGEPVTLEPEHVQALSDLADGMESHMEWISALPRYIDIGSHLIVHAGIRPGRSLEEQTLEDLTELRSLDGPKPGSRVGTPWFELYHGEKTVIFGHWVFKTPLVRKNAIGIDTGCVYGGQLTAMVLPDGHLVSVPARRVYARKKE